MNRIPRSFRAPFLVMLTALLVGPVLTIEAVAAPAAMQRQTTLIRIDNFTFGPRVLTIPAGTTVTWTNNDDTPHTVVATNKAFRSKPLDTGDSFAFTFDRPGEFQYFCGLHPHMTGKIIVRAG